MATNVRHPDEFNCIRDKSLNQRWENYKLKMERYFVMMSINQPEQKQAALLYYGGDDLSNTFDTIKHQLVLQDGEIVINQYQATINLFNKQFSSGESLTYERSNFRATLQLEGESVTDFITRLRKKAKYCKFAEYNEDSAIIDQFIEACTSKNLRVKLLATNDLTLDSLLSIALSRENAVHQAEDIIKNAQVETNITHDPISSDLAMMNMSNQKRKSYQREQQYCYGCGKTSHIHGSSNCPAKGKECHNCGRRDHFKAMCRSQSNGNRGRYHNSNTANSGNSAYNVTSNDSNEIGLNQHNNRNDISEHNDTAHFSSSNGRTYLFRAADINAIRSNKHKLRTVNVDDIEVSFIVDSGATTSIIDKTTYHVLFRHVRLEKAPTNIYTYGAKEPIPLLGVFYPTFLYRNNKTVGPLVVTNIENAGCLLSEQISTQLGIIKMDQFANAVLNESVENLLDEFSELSSGIGKLKDFQLKLDIDPSIKPTAQTAYRTIPYHLLKLVDQNIAKLLSAGILERVESPTTWCSPLQVVKQDNGDVRLCVDLREANKAVRRTLFPIPTLDDVCDKILGAKYFSKVDLRKGYHQIELDEESRDITTFRYQNGIFRYTRLVFGLSSAFELFQQKISFLFEGEAGIMNISDDILISGNTAEEHNANLRKCFTILKDNGLTINQEKCVFMVPELEYYGFVISGKGIKPAESKVEAIQSTTVPKNPKEVRSFLGLINYLGRFIPHLATHTEPLRKLTTKDYPWTWAETQQKCFNYLKNIVTQDEVMCHFDSSKQTKIVVDASPVGLGAIILQNQGRDTYKPVCYASRSLSQVEQRYSQTEREALGVVWACEKFHLYLYAKHFIVQTDHKPLIGLFNSNGNRSARINKWALRLLQYDFDLCYLPGKENPADVLSRYSSKYENITTGWSSGYELEAEQHLNFVIGHAIPQSITLTQIRNVCSQDDDTLKLINAIDHGDWHKYPQLKAYIKVSQELTHKGGIVLRGSQIVIPQRLRKHVLSIAHRNHLGISKTKSLLRSKVWWPLISKDVEQLIKSCNSCILVQPAQKPEPLTMTTMPGCWSKLNVDICGPFPDGWSIIGVIDAGSRWPEVFIVKSTITSVITNKLTELFVNKGRPLEIVSDNGPQFTSLEFQQFCKSWGIHHHAVTPEYPQANSEIERFFKTILKTIRIAVVEGKDWKDELRHYLLTYRNTPHSTTGKSPAELMYGRNLRDNLPSPEASPTTVYKEAETFDKQQKQIIKKNADKDQKLKPSSIKIGDTVVMKQRKRNKFSTNFGKPTYKVLNRNKATLKIQSNSGKIYRRHTSAVRVIPTSTNPSQYTYTAPNQYESDSSVDFEDFDGVTIPVVQNRNISIPIQQVPPIPVALEDLPPLHDSDNSEWESDTEGEDQQHSPQEPTSPSDQSTFIRRSVRQFAGGGVARYPM